MPSKLVATAVVTAMLTLSGCESKQAKVQRLEAEYDRLNKQYQKDCLGTGGSNAEGVNDALLGKSGDKPAPPKLTPEQQAKCKEEKAKLDPLADELLKAQQP